MWITCEECGFEAEISVWAFESNVAMGDPHVCDDCIADNLPPEAFMEIEVVNEEED